MRWLILALGLGLFATAAPAASIQARLIRASTEQESSDPELDDISPKLKRTFGFQHYQQLGRKQAKLEAGKSLSIDLGKGFVVLVKPKSIKEGHYELAIEWFGGKTLITQQTTKFADGQLLFIKGPEVGRDWIILALSVVE